MEGNKCHDGVLYSTSVSCLHVCENCFVASRLILRESWMHVVYKSISSKKLSENITERKCY